MTKSTRRAALCGVLAPVVALAALWLSGAFEQGVTAVEPSEALKEAARGLDEIEIYARLEPETRTLHVTQSLTLKNRTGAALDAAVLRTWANAFTSADTSPAASQELYEQCYPDGFSTGALIMKAARIQSGEGYRDIAWRYLDEQKTALSLPVSWAVGSLITLALEYEVIVPLAAYRFGVRDGVYALGNAFATPAVYNGGEWRTDAYGAIGDPFVSDCANYTVYADLPEGFKCAGSAQPSVDTAGGRAVYGFRALAVRDFALVAGEGLYQANDSARGVSLTSLALSAGEAKEALRYMKRALECYSERYGEYPYPSLCCAGISFPMGGMEYPGLVMLSHSALQTGGDTLELLVAHEVAHQWWYAVVGSDPVNDAWQDEALCEFSTLEYLERYYGRARRDELEASRIESAMRLTVPGGLTPGMPVSYFDSMTWYSLVVYNRGAAFFTALDRLLPDGLQGALREYYDRYAFRRATREELLSLIAEVSGEDIAPLATDYLDTEMAS